VLVADSWTAFGARRIALTGAPLCALGNDHDRTHRPGVARLVCGMALLLHRAGGKWSHGLGERVVTRCLRGESRLALGVALSGAGVGAMVFPSLIVWLLDRFGWRGGNIAGLRCSTWRCSDRSYFSLSLGGSKKLRPRRRQAQRIVRPPPDWFGGMLIKEEICSYDLLRIAFFVAATGTAISAISVHLQPLMTDNGLTRAASRLDCCSHRPCGNRRAPDRWCVASTGSTRDGSRSASLRCRQLAASWLVNFHGSYLRGLLAAISVGLASGVEATCWP